MSIQKRKERKKMLWEYTEQENICKNVSGEFILKKCGAKENGN